MNGIEMKKRWNRVLLTAALTAFIAWGVFCRIYSNKYENSIKEKETVIVYTLVERLNIGERTVKAAAKTDFDDELGKIINIGKYALFAAENDIFSLIYEQKYNELDSYYNIKNLFEDLNSALDEKYSRLRSGGEYGDINLKLEKYAKNLSSLKKYFLHVAEYLHSEAYDKIGKYGSILSLIEEKEGISLSSVVKSVGLLADIAASDKTEGYALLEGKQQITEKDARKIVGKIFGDGIKLSLAGKDLSEKNNVVFDSCEPHIYRFYCENAYADITVAGGYLKSFHCERKINDSGDSLSDEELISSAFDFLKKFGYENFKLVSHNGRNGKFYVEFACIQTTASIDAVCMMDNIRMVLVAENGKIMYFNADGYLKNHRIRSLPENIITPEMALEGLGSVAVTEIYPAFFGNEEKLCYRIITGEEVYYIDAENGKLRSCSCGA